MVKKFILTGGGTLGSVTPLVALKEVLEKKSQEPCEFLWVGSQTGVEREFLSKFYPMSYKVISCGKWRRYFSGQNFLDIFRGLRGFLQSLAIIRSFQPDYILTAGSFVAVPVVLAGWLLGKKILVHHQDLRVGLANKIMARFATLINVTFIENFKDFSGKNTVCFGNLIRPEILAVTKEQGRKFFKLLPEVPVVLILGGGTGALFLNNLINQSSQDLLSFCQIIHITGKDKSLKTVGRYQEQNLYLIYELLGGDIKYAFAAADLVVTRAGMGVLSELLALGKPMVIVPITDNQQEENAKYLQTKGAAEVLFENLTDAKVFGQKIKEILSDKQKQALLGVAGCQLMPQDAADKLAEILLK